MTPALLAVAVVSGCSADSTLGGDRLPVKIPAESYGNDSGALSGVVALEANGCWTIDIGPGESLLVFPEGWGKDETGSLMLSPDGQIDVGDGDTIVGVGGVVAADSFPDVPDGYWGNYLVFCDLPRSEFAVFDQIIEVTE